VPLSTDPAKIRFFGTLMPALLLLKTSPATFIRHQILRRATPTGSVADYVDAEADDAARVGDTLVFVHRWHTSDFDPIAFSRAKTFLERLARLVRQGGYAAEPFDPLSPDLNLPHLAADAGLGDLSPFGLLVHPIFGPRVILSALRTSHPLTPAHRWLGTACTDCFACLQVCPQTPIELGVIELGACQSCARCLAVCPIGASHSPRSGG
jgi:epoxyqueuosine reductase QueG